MAQSLRCDPNWAAVGRAVERKIALKSGFEIFWHCGDEIYAAKLRKKARRIPWYSLICCVAVFQIERIEDGN